MASGPASRARSPRVPGSGSARAKMIGRSATGFDHVGRDAIALGESEECVGADKSFRKGAGRGVDGEASSEGPCPWCGLRRRTWESHIVIRAIAADAEFHDVFGAGNGTPAAPLKTTSSSSRRLPTRVAAFNRAAPAMIALLCWSSWKTGIRSVRRSSSSMREASGSFLEIDAAERRFEKLAGAYDLLRILGIEFDVENVDVGEPFETGRPCLPSQAYRPGLRCFQGRGLCC